MPATNVTDATTGNHLNRRHRRLTSDMIVLFPDLHRWISTRYLPSSHGHSCRRLRDGREAEAGGSRSVRGRAVTERRNRGPLQKAATERVASVDRAGAIPPEVIPPTGWGLSRFPAVARWSDPTAPCPAGGGRYSGTHGAGPAAGATSTTSQEPDCDAIAVIRCGRS